MTKSITGRSANQRWWEVGYWRDLATAYTAWVQVNGIGGGGDLWIGFEAGYKAATQATPTEDDTSRAEHESHVALCVAMRDLLNMIDAVQPSWDNGVKAPDGRDEGDYLAGCVIDRARAALAASGW